jgi:hypothetical protein
MPVVGWITDGRDDIAISHAWLDVNGKKIDLTLGRVIHESMLVRVVIRGSKHSYFVERSIWTLMPYLPMIPKKCASFWTVPPTTGPASV